jgi:hypothetical protein
VNRIWVDKPAGSCHHTSNLPTFLNRAHRRYLLWRIWCFCGALRPASRRWI